MLDAAAMLSEIDDHGFADISTTRKVNAINNAMWEIESMEQWPFLETSITLTFNGSSGTPTNAPSNFRTILRAKDLTTGRRIGWVRLDEYEDTVGLQASLVGNPTIFYLEGGVVKFWPIPSASATVRMRYIKYTTAVTDLSAESAFSIPPQYHNAIVMGALGRIYDMEDDPELSERARGRMETEVARMKVAVFQNQLDRPDFIRVDFEDLDYA